MSSRSNDAVRAYQPLVKSPGFWAGVISLALLALLRTSSAATTTGVWFFGAPNVSSCSLRDSMGFPCPGCGFTRSVILAVSGKFSDAWMLNPGGVLSIVGIFFFGLTMVGFSIWYRSAKDPARTNEGFKKIILGFVAYLSLVTVFAIARWLLGLFGILAFAPELFG